MNDYLAYKIVLRDGILSSNNNDKSRVIKEPDNYIFKI